MEEIINNRQITAKLISAAFTESRNADLEIATPIIQKRAIIQYDSSQLRLGNTEN